MPPSLEHRHVAEFLGDLYDKPVAKLRIRRRALRGGLSSALSLVRASFYDQGVRRASVFVVKTLEGDATREAAVYRRLESSVAQSFTPRLLRVQEIEDHCCLLYIERVSPASAWPWTRTTNIARVLDCLAALHATEPHGWAALSAWDYDSELKARAQDLLRLAEDLPRGERTPALSRSLPALRRIIAALPRLRRQLLDLPPLGRALIHGDVHSGNVAMRRRGSGCEPVLFDWGRARVGSPLEDVSSWLQVLGRWEPEAKRRHDTLLAHYLAARGLTASLTRSLRDAYWLAGASNALAGALLYHLATSVRPDISDQERWLARVAAADWLRVVRRADACLH